VTAKAIGSPSLAFVLIKAFGDLTIAASVVRRLPEDARGQCSLVIAPHLADLARLLAPNCAVEPLPLGPALPPLFDLKKHGLARIARSALELRRVLSIAAPGRPLVFDRLSYRERFIVGHRAALPIGEDLAPNVYQAHEQFLRRTLPGVELAPAARPVAATSNRRLGLLPFSRVSAKNVPPDVLGDLAGRARGLGFDPVVLLLEGERFPATPGLPIETLPRNFDALAAGLRSVDAVVSADSLPAHLAEYVGRPAFVAGPVANAYYLPPATFAGEHWGLFSAPAELALRFERFLRQLP
jgi:hypothetical protein